MFNAYSLLYPQDIEHDLPVAISAEMLNKWMGKIILFCNLTLLSVRLLIVLVVKKRKHRRNRTKYMQVFKPNSKFKWVGFNLKKHKTNERQDGFH